MSEDELKQLLAWLESPTNKKYQQLAGEMRNNFVQKLLAEMPAVGRPEAAGARRPHPRHPRRAAARRRRRARAPRAGAAAPRASSARSHGRIARRRRPPTSSRCAGASTRSIASCSRCSTGAPTVASAIGELKRAEGSPAFRPEREAAVIDALKAAQRRARCRRASVAPIWREIMSACRSLETPTRVAYLGPGGDVQRARRARLLRLVDRPPAVRQRRRGVPRDERRRRRLRRRSGRELERGRRHALARPVPDDAADDRRRDQPLRPPQPAAQGRFARRHRRGLRASAGARAVPRLAQPPPAGRRAPAGREQRRRRAPRRPRRHARRHRQRARGERVRPLRRRAGDPGRRPQPDPLRDRRPSRERIRSRRRRGTTARASSSRSRTGRARCTTCCSR